MSLGRFATDGAIGNGEAVPGDGPDGPGPDTQLRDEVYGNFHNPQRSGKGIQLTLENDGETFILTYYTYLDGEQVWLIGVGERSGNTLSFPEVYVTDGGDFGGRFRAEDVENILFGSIDMVLDDCNSATINVDADVEGFIDQTLNVQKILVGSCSD